MKGILFSIFGAFFVSSGMFAQCVPDLSIVVPGNYPASLPHAIVGIPYSSNIQIRVLTDTLITVGAITVNATVDSIVVTGSAGLPPGFNYSCTPSSCHFPGGSNGCIQIQGSAPTSGMAGTYPIRVFIVAYGHAPIVGNASLPDTIDGYSIIIDHPTGISQVPSNKFEVFQNAPNPFRETTEIAFNSPGTDLFTLKVSNLLGKVVYFKSIVAQKGTNKIYFSGKEYEAGIYIYSISNSKNTITRRMIVSNE